MNREYQKWYSRELSRDMEMLIFGDRGAPVVFFPTRTARFYDYENWKVIEAIKHKIEAGFIQVYCVDSIDIESFYCKEKRPEERILRHVQYEKYIVNELLPFIKNKNQNPFIISAGCSLGGYHAINLAFRHPHLFGKAVGMSARYDLTLYEHRFADLFDGYSDQNIYYHMPSKFIPNLNDPAIIRQLQKMQITFAIGKEDPFFENNLYLHNCLLKKGIENQLFVWEGEAHRSSSWRQMVQFYL